MTDPSEIDEKRLLEAYRALPRPEPPAALDAAVRAHARAALATVRPARSRWVAGLASAAVLTLAVGTGWQMRENTLGTAPLSPIDTRPEAGAEAVVGAVAESTPLEADAGSKSADNSAPRPDSRDVQPVAAEQKGESATRQDRSERQRSMQDETAGSAQQSRQPYRAQAPPRAVVPAPLAAAAPEAPPPTPPAQEAAAAPPAASMLRKSTARAVEGGADGTQSTAIDALAKPAPQADSVPEPTENEILANDDDAGSTRSIPQTLSPLEWLDAIRRMRDQGDTRRAADALAQFRAVYPDEPVPDDLKNLLP